MFCCGALASPEVSGWSLSSMPMLRARSLHSLARLADVSGILAVEAGAGCAAGCAAFAVEAAAVELAEGAGVAATAVVVLLFTCTLWYSIPAAGAESE